jgi:DNA-binding transcriptional regulator YdaS (Cro superfamily)
MSTASIGRAVDLCGTQASLARAINVPPALVWQWVNGRRPVAAKHCIGIEDATAGAVTRYDLRPDVFGPKPPQQDQAA